jgi:hypothetical protein
MYFFYVITEKAPSKRTNWCAKKEKELAKSTLNDFLQLFNLDLF